MVDAEITFGFPEEWRAFRDRNSQFLDRFPNLKSAWDSVFLRTYRGMEAIDKVIFFLGRTCMEDFFELMLMAGNGYGYGAQKILRGLYERAVTMAYLSDHPEELDAYMNFHYVAQHKLMFSIKDTLGMKEDMKLFEADVERRFNEVKDDYLITSCKKCKSTRRNHTRSKLDVPSLAKKTGVTYLVWTSVFPNLIRSFQNSVRIYIFVVSLSCFVLGVCKSNLKWQLIFLCHITS